MFIYLLVQHQTVLEVQSFLFKMGLFSGEEKNTGLHAVVHTLNV